MYKQPSSDSTFANPEGGLKPPSGLTNAAPAGLRTWLAAQGEGGLEPPFARQVAARVFARLTAQFGAKLLDYWAAAPGVRDEWARALAQLHPTEIDRGLRATSRRAFVPALGEFVQLCRPALDPETAWDEAAAGMAARERGGMGEWSHPAVYRAASRFSWELRCATYAAQRRRWAAALAREFDAGWGEPIPPPTLRIARQELRCGPPSAEVRARIAALLADRRAPGVRPAPPRAG